jgi:hypothetical protein
MEDAGGLAYVLGFHNKSMQNQGIFLSFKRFLPHLIPRYFTLPFHLADLRTYIRSFSSPFPCL